MSSHGEQSSAEGSAPLSGYAWLRANEQRCPALLV
jgi:hypothetical protein